MKYYRKLFLLEWPESMGPEWLNTDNLSSLLFTPKFSRKTILFPYDVTTTVEIVAKIAAGINNSPLIRKRVAAIIEDMQAAGEEVSFAALAQLFSVETEIGQVLAKMEPRL